MLGLGSALCGSALAGSATFNFDTDPSAAGSGFVTGSNVSWTDPTTFDQIDFYEDRDFNGQGEGGNPASGGYLAITRSANSQYSQILFPDFDNGLVVKAFTFDCDLRLGNATGNDGRPADGFSLNYARAGDPAVEFLQANPGTSDSNNYAIPGAPEGGTRTGLSICFDTWSGNTWPSGETDIEGIIVRVDNVTVVRYAMPTRNGACDDITSLQTGPYNADAGGDYKANPLSPNYVGLCWTPLNVELSEAGELTVKFKGATLLDKAPTGYAPSAGRILLAGRTGGANQNNHIDNLVITTVPADKMIIGPPTGNAYGFQFTISDSGQSVLNPSTLVLRYDGNTVTPTSVTKPAGSGITTIVYTDTNTRLAAGSSHTLDVSAQDVPGATVTRNSTYTIPDYVLVPAAWKVAGTPTNPGMTVRTHMIDETIVSGFTGRYPTDANFVQNAETQFAGGYVDPETRTPYDNNADPVTTDVTTVNWEQAGVDVAGENFGSALPAANPVPNEWIPGVLGFNNDNIVAETTAYVMLKKGINRMGVNSDDGFKLTVAPGQPSVTGVVLGQFNGGRGASDTIFDFVVDEEGYYPLRLLWWEGDGGGNCEWFSVDTTTGEKMLINGTVTAAPRAFRTGAGRAVLRSVLPADNSSVMYRPSGAIIRADLVDGSTTVVDGSVKLFINGNDVTSQAQIVNGATTTVRFTPTGATDWGETPNWQLAWTESTTPPTEWTHNFTFRLAPDDLPGNVFAIEAEDHDYNSGQTVAAASTMPYVTPAYDGLEGVLNVDYFDDQNEDLAANNISTYRGDKRPNHADFVTHTGRFSTDRPGAPSTTEMTLNYRLGWAGNFWGNYTRSIPAGTYAAYAGLSIDNSNAGGMSATLDRVTSGVGTTTQTTERIGTFTGRGNGGWGNNELAPLRAADGSLGAVRIGTGNSTLRVTATSGDFDFVLLVPASFPPKLIASEPKNLRFAVPRDAVLSWTFEDFSTTFNTASAALSVNGAAVPAAQLTVAKNGAITTITYDPPGLFEIGKNHTYQLTWADSAGTSFANSGNFIATFMPDSPTGMFLVEAEDFNTGGGQVQAAVNTMPYLGNAYNGLGAAVNVDYLRTDAEPSGDIYRTGETPNVPMSTDGDLVRARDASGNPSWTLDTNYRLGWAGGGRWQNYTRNVPAGDYQVWASMSYGEAPGSAVRVIGNLSRVTSAATQPDQTTEPLGFFRGPATGGWGTNELFPMRATDATSGDASVVSLGGVATFQFEYASADFDYMMLVPVGGADRPRFTSIRRNADGTLTVEWTGGGVLEAAAAVNGPWQEVPGATSPYTLTPAAPATYGRIRVP